MHMHLQKDVHYTFYQWLFLAKSTKAEEAASDKLILEQEETVELCKG